MSTRFLVTSASAVVLLAGGLIAGQQDQKQQEEPDVKVQAGDVQVEANGALGAQQRERRNLDETTFRQSRPLIHRASALIGMEVQNSAGKDLGEIEDLAIDGHTGKIEYAALSFGGLGDVGDKLFAIPWDTIQVKQVGDADEDNWVAVVNISQQTLETARGFDQDNWPDMADERWRTENDRLFRTTERSDETTTPQR
jgi:sporulation protein YlmC with PRC-barrel domain